MWEFLNCSGIVPECVKLRLSINEIPLRSERDWLLPDLWLIFEYVKQASHMGYRWATRYRNHRMIIMWKSFCQPNSCY